MSLDVTTSTDSAGSATGVSDKTGTAAPAQSAPATAEPSLQDVQMEAATRLLAGLSKSDDTVSPASDTTYTTDKTAKAGEQPRDPVTKRFVKGDTTGETDASATDKAAADTKTDAAADPAETDTKPTDAAPPAIAPPQSWAADVREKWATLDPVVQQYIVDRERDAHRQISRQGQELRQIADFAMPLATVAQQHEDYLKQIELPPHQALGNLLDFQRYMDANPQAAISYLAEKYGVTLPASAVPDAAGDDLPPDPQVLRLQQQLAATQNQLRQLETNLTARERQAMAERQERERVELDRQERQTMAAVNAFARKNPHFATLNADGDLIALVNVIRQSEPDLTTEQVLQKAYDRAVWANPRTRAIVVKDQQTQAERERAEKAKAAAAQAKQAGSINVRGAAASPPQSISVADAQKEVLRKYGMAS